MNIEIDGLTKTYGPVTALADVSFEIERGSTFGLLGTNGAGKTTLFKLLVGHDRPTDGRIRIGETDVSRAGRQVRELVGYLPQTVGFPGRLSGREVLAFTARARRMDADERRSRIPEVVETVGLSDAIDRAVGGYSGGMRRRLGLATAILARPPVLVLDEPTAGLDPEGVAEFHRVVEAICEETNTTVVFSSHALTEVESLCDSVAVLHDGRLRAAGPVSELAADVADVCTVRAAVDDLETATTVASRYGTATPTDDGLEVHCDAGHAAGLVSALEDAVAVDDLEIDRPGLETVFRDAIGLPTDGGVDR